MKIKGKRAAGIFLITAGVLLIAAAVILFLYNSGENRNSEKEIAEILPAVRQVIEERRTEIEETGEIGSPEAAPSAEIDGNEYIGILEVPSAGLEMPVFSSYDEEKLKIAPCRYYGRADSDDLVIAGHNYSSGFGQLENVKRGENVYFTDMNGNIYSYTVGEIETLEPDAVKYMTDSQWQLSLYTCTYSGKQRLTIRCGK